MNTNAVTDGGMKWRILILTFACGGGVALHAADWPQWRGSARDGSTPERVAPWKFGGPTKIWSVKVGTGFSAISVAEGRAVTMGFSDGQDHVVCLDAATGGELWRYSYPSQLKPNMYDGGPGATPAIVGGRVYTLGKMGDARALDAATGAVVWAKNLAHEVELDRPQWSFAGSPVVVDGLVLFNLGAHGLAVDAATGTVRWSSPAGPTGYASPVPFESGGRPLVAMFGGKQLSAVEPATGAVAWTFAWRTSYGVNASDPVPVAGHLLVSSGYGKGAALLDLATTPPKPVWETKRLRSQFTPMIVTGGFVYGIDGDAPGKPPLVCVFAGTGDVRWKEDNIGTGGLVLAGDDLVVLTSRGELLLAPASPHGFKPVARAQILGGTCWTAPSIANGRLYARNSLGQVVCLQVGAVE